MTHIEELRKIAAGAVAADDYIRKSCSSAADRMQKIEAALDLICSLVQPMGRNDTGLMSAQGIAREALEK